MNVAVIKQEYQSDGGKKFYRSLLFLALNKLVLIERGEYKGQLPHTEYLEYYSNFLHLYRREGDEIYLEIAKVLRRVSHKVYRIMLKKGMINLNLKFLNLV